MPVSTSLRTCGKVLVVHVTAIEQLEACSRYNLSKLRNVRPSDVEVQVVEDKNTRFPAEIAESRV